MQHRHALYILAVLCTASAGVASQLFSGFIPRIAADFHSGLPLADATRMIGSYGGASFLLGWALGAFTLGAVSDRFGRKRTYFVSVLLATSCMLFISLANSFEALVVIRFLMGMGVGSVLAQSVVMVSEAFPSASRAIVVGILINAFPTGFIIAGFITQATDEWRIAYQWSSVTMALSLAVVLIVRESDLWFSSNTASAGRRIAPWHGEHKKDLAISITLFGSMLVGLWAVLAWMPTYVAKISLPEQSQHNRALINIMLGSGNLAGGLFSGLLSNRIGRRWAASIGYTGCLISTIVTFQTGLGPTPMLFACTFIICVFVGLNQGILSGYIPELFPTSMRGVATGMSMNVGRLLTVVGVFFVGVLVQTLGGYDNAISIFAASYLVGLLALTRARETRGLELPK